MDNFSGNNGVTLMEMLIALAILGILSAVAMPSFTDMLGRSSVNGAVKSLNNTFTYAKGESVTRGTDVSICPSSTMTDCASGSWATGWIVFVDNNGDADGASGSVDVGDEIIQVYQPLADVVLTSAADLIQYDSRGFGLNSTVQTLKICPEDNDANNARAVEIGVSGRVRIVEGGLACP